MKFFSFEPKKCLSLLWNQKCEAKLNIKSFLEERWKMLSKIKQFFYLGKKVTLVWSKKILRWSKTKMLCKLSEKKRKMSPFVAWAREKKAKWLPFRFISLRSKMFLCKTGAPQRYANTKHFVTFFDLKPEKMHQIDTGNCLQQEKGAIQIQASSDFNKQI